MTVRRDTECDRETGRVRQSDTQRERERERDRERGTRDSDGLSVNEQPCLACRSELAAGSVGRV